MAITIPNILSTTGPTKTAGIETEDGYSPFMSLVQDREELGSFDSATGWTVLGNDTIDLTTSANHVLGTNSLSFAKVDGLAGTIFGGIQKTITSVDCSRFMAHDQIVAAMSVSSVANIAYAFVRLGTDSSNYTEWRFDDSLITVAVWQEISMTLVSAQLASVGTGWNPAAITYISVGTAHDAETDALAAILFDHLAIESAQFTVT